MDEEIKKVAEFKFDPENKDQSHIKEQEDYQTLMQCECEEDSIMGSMKKLKGLLDKFNSLKNGE